MTTVTTPRRSIYRQFGKRALDLLLVIPVLLVAAPLILLLAGVVWLRLGRPVFFRQVRPGRGGVPFRIVKLRTMREIGSTSAAAPDSIRLTGVGRFVRRWSFDELPELWNVLCGDMSLVGPRPLLMEYLPRYDQRQMRRHDVKPGLTGWAQVNGRNETSWPERMELDVWYAEHLSMRLDLAILARTPLTVTRGAGVSAPGHPTMAPFREGDSD